MNFAPHQLSYLLHDIANGVASLGLLLLIVYAMAFGIRQMAGRGPKPNLTVVKVGILLCLAGSAVAQLVLMCDPGLGGILLRQQAGALISQSARVEGDLLGVTILTHATRAVINLILAAGVCAVIGAFQRPGRGLGKQWPNVARLADKLAAYARRKADEGGHGDGGEARAKLRPATAEV